MVTNKNFQYVKGVASEHLCIDSVHTWLDDNTCYPEEHKCRKSSKERMKTVEGSE